MEGPEKENEVLANQPAIEVDLEKKEEQQQQIVEKKSDRDPIEEARVWQRRLEYQARLMERQNREMQELKQLLTPKPVQEDPNEDPIDRTARKDWKAGVRMVIRETFQQEQARLRQEEHRNSKERELQESRARVRERYPMIDDENDQQTRLYIETMNENPGLLSNPNGPELVMYKMEEKMRAQGRLTPDVRPIVQKELNRRARIGASQIPTGRIGKPNTYTLNQEQRAFCDRNNIPYDQYARDAKRLDQGEE